MKSKRGSQNGTKRGANRESIMGLKSQVTSGPRGSVNKSNVSSKTVTTSCSSLTSLSRSKTLSTSLSASLASTVKAFHNCFGCKKPIKRDKYLLKACNKFWHENCLRCDRCHKRLGELGSTLYCKSGMHLCRQDYLEMFGKTGVCSVCEKLIHASEMVMKAKENVYHLECFACQLCSQRFCVGDRFYLCENKVVCEYDYEEHFLPFKGSIFQELSQSQQQPQQPATADSYVEEEQPKLSIDNVSQQQLLVTSASTESLHREEAVDYEVAEEEEEAEAEAEEEEQVTSDKSVPELETLEVSNTNLASEVEQVDSSEMLLSPSSDDGKKMDTLDWDGGAKSHCDANEERTKSEDDM